MTNCWFSAVLSIGRPKMLPAEPADSKSKQKISDWLIVPQLAFALIKEEISRNSRSSGTRYHISKIVVFFSKNAENAKNCPFFILFAYKCLQHDLDTFYDLKFENLRPMFTLHFMPISAHTGTRFFLSKNFWILLPFWILIHFWNFDPFLELCTYLLDSDPFFDYNSCFEILIIAFRWLTNLFMKVILG